VLRHAPDPVALGLAPGPVTGWTDESNPDETTAAVCGVVGRGGPASESRENWADAVWGGRQRRPGSRFPRRDARPEPSPFGGRAVRFE